MTDPSVVSAEISATIVLNLHLSEPTVGGRNPANQLRLVVGLSHLFQVLYISGAAGFLPSTVCYRYCFYLSFKFIFFDSHFLWGENSHVRHFVTTLVSIVMPLNCDSVAQPPPPSSLVVLWVYNTRAGKVRKRLLHQESGHPNFLKGRVSYNPWRMHGTIVYLYTCYFTIKINHSCR